MPIITLEVMPDSSLAENIPYDQLFPEIQQNTVIGEDPKDPNIFPKHEDSTGVHFLVDKTRQMEINDDSTDQNANMSTSKERRQLEYTMRSNGSVCCKLCGKILASRSHWSRHKYRAHMMNSVNPAPLFQCEQCLIYFKSRKGYIGHIASKHSETLQDASPVLTNAQVEALAKEQSIIQQHSLQESTHQTPTQSNPANVEPSHFDPKILEEKKEPDPEISIPKTVVPTYQNVAGKLTNRRNSTESPPKKVRITRQNMPRGLDVLEHVTVENQQELKEKRSREEKLVADIIARVRRECEAQGSGGSRRGYSRKSVHT